MKALGLVALAACGRINFDPLNLGDDTPIADGPIGDDAPPDGPQLMSTCTMPIVAQLGVPIAGSTCSGGNAIDTCGPGVEEHVFEFTAVVAGSYQFSVTPDGFELGTLNANCTQSNICAGGLTIGLTAGQTLKLSVEKGLTGCGDFTFTVDQAP